MIFTFGKSDNFSYATLCLYFILFQAELANLVSARDDARRDLYDKLTVCVDELEKMPLEKRTASVQVSITLDEAIILSITYPLKIANGANFDITLLFVV